jgi:uncharacterized membrane protein
MTADEEIKNTIKGVSSPQRPTSATILAVAGFILYAYFILVGAAYLLLPYEEAYPYYIASLSHTFDGVWITILGIVGIIGNYLLIKMKQSGPFISFVPACFSMAVTQGSLLTYIALIYVVLGFIFLLKHRKKFLPQR